MYKYFCVTENKAVFNWTSCQLLSEKPNCMKISILFCLNISTVFNNTVLFIKIKVFDTKTLAAFKIVITVTVAPFKASEN